MVAIQGRSTEGCHDGGLPAKTTFQVVDNWHRRWPSVLKFIDDHSQRSALMLNGDGWLSARQSVVAAFSGYRVLGALCFHVQPIASKVEPVRLEAQQDAPLIGSSEVSVKLLEFALGHARAVRCRQFRDMDGAIVSARKPRADG